MDRPKVSIVMAVKNSERFLAEALNSISSQSYSQYEIIVVDGGSTDDSRRIAKSTPHVICLDQTGCGFANAWNTGLSASKSPLVAFLDSDDIWARDKLARQVDMMTADSALDCVVGRVKFFLEGGDAVPAGFKPSLLEGSHVAYMPGVPLVRRSVFKKLGLFEEHWEIANDLVWFAKFREFGYKTAFVDDIVLNKRVHAGNLSYVTAWSSYRREILQMLKASLDRRRDPNQSQ